MKILKYYVRTKSSRIEVQVRVKAVSKLKVKDE